MGTRELDPAVVRSWPLVGEHYVDPQCPAAGDLIGGQRCTCVSIHHIMFKDDIEVTDADYAERRVGPAREERDMGILEAMGIGDLVDNNPKTRQGALKAPLHLVPPSAQFHLAEALADGARKYGAYNWRSEPITTSVYIGAIQRHMMAYLDGEDLAQDSGVSHLAHVMACCALLLDSKSLGILQDDRPAAGASPKLLEEYHKARTAS